MDARGLPASGREAAARTAAVAGERAVSAYDNVKLYSEYTMKTGNLICLLLSLAIVGHVVYALLSESEPPRLVSQGKSYTVKELNNEGYNPEICFSGDFSLSLYNPQIQISAESETKRSIFREKDKTKRSKKESAQHSKSRNKSFVMTSVSAL